MQLCANNVITGNQTKLMTNGSKKVLSPVKPTIYADKLGNSIDNRKSTSIAAMNNANINAGRQTTKLGSSKPSASIILDQY